METNTAALRLRNKKSATLTIAWRFQNVGNQKD
jgi:hypothetical protein